MFPSIGVRVHLKDQTGYQVIVRSFSTIGQEAGCTFPDLTANYLDNLSRLGLIESPGTLSVGSVFLSAPNTYEPLEQSDEIKTMKEKVEAEGHRLECGPSFVRMTDLGQQFCLACVIEKSGALGT